MILIIEFFEFIMKINLKRTQCITAHNYITTPKGACGMEQKAFGSRKL